MIGPRKFKVMLFQETLDQTLAGRLGMENLRVFGLVLTNVILGPEHRHRMAGR